MQKGRSTQYFVNPMARSAIEASTTELNVALLGSGTCRVMSHFPILDRPYGSFRVDNFLNHSEGVARRKLMRVTTRVMIMAMLAQMVTKATVGIWAQQGIDQTTS